MYNIKKVNDSLLITKVYGQSIKWSVTIPINTDRVSWTAEIGRIASSMGYGVLLDRKKGVASVSPVSVENNGTSKNVDKIEAGGDAWRTVYCRVLDALIDRHGLGAVSSSFPTPKKKEPAIIDYNKTIDYYLKAFPGKDKTALKILRDPSYSEPMALGYNYLSKHNRKEGTTGLKVIECCCGRCFLGQEALVTKKRRRTDWNTCGCIDAYPKESLDKNKSFAAFREYCTMALACSDPRTAIYKALKGLNLCQDNNLPDYKTFKEWYIFQVKGKSNLFVERIDKNRPFSLDNLYFPKRRNFFVDDKNIKCYILAL